MFNAFLEPCYPCGIGTNENRVIAAVALPGTIPLAAPKVTDYSIRRQQVALLPSIYASLCTSRYPAQDSRPSGSLFLSRKALSSSASCRFIAAHCDGLNQVEVDRPLSFFAKGAVVTDPKARESLQAAYSFRSATMGSTRVARRAGTKHASSATNSRIAATAISVIGSPG